MRTRTMWIRWGERLLLLAAVALAVILADQKATLQEAAGRTLQRVTRPQVGMYVPEFSAMTLDGRAVRIGTPPAGSSQVLYFFQTSCKYCRASTPRVRALAERFQSTRSDQGGVSTPAFVSLSLDSVPPTEATLRRQGVAGPIVHLTSRRLMTLYRTGSVPRLDVINGEGRLTYTRTGVVLTDAVVDSVMAAAKATEQMQ